VVDRIYTDTSVIGGCEDDEFRVHSRRLMARFTTGDARLVLSELVLRELDAAPPAVRDIVTAIPTAHVEIIRFSPEAEALARQYLAEGILTINMFADAQHIAMATVARVDVLVSWNFRHVVNLARIQRVHRVNAHHGYPAIEIRSPREVAPDE
jgi:hypothetical protein